MLFGIRDKWGSEKVTFITFIIKRTLFSFPYDIGLTLLQMGKGQLLIFG